MLDLDAGLAAILPPDDDADRDEPVIAANPGSLSPSRAGTSLPGGQAAVIIVTRSNVLALVDALADALNLARDLARDPVTRDRDRATRDRDLARLRVVARACGLARDLDLDLDRATLDLDRAWATLDHARAPLDRARKLARDITLALGVISGTLHGALARDLIFEIQNALRYARDLARRFEAVEVDASGADLSALDITNIWVLEGVVWTEETTWPPGVREQVQSRSREIRPGVYKVQGGSERDPSQLITT